VRDRRTIGLADRRNSLADRYAIGLADCCTIGLADRRTIGLADRRTNDRCTVRLTDRCTIDLTDRCTNDCRTIGLAHRRTVGLTDRCTNGTSFFQPKRDSDRGAYDIADVWSGGKANRAGGRLPRKLQCFLGLRRFVYQSAILGFRRRYP
jgi:hypothetical protein